MYDHGIKNWPQAVSKISSHCFDFLKHAAIGICGVVIVFIIFAAISSHEKDFELEQSRLAVQIETVIDSAHNLDDEQRHELITKLISTYDAEHDSLNPVKNPNSEKRSILEILDLIKMKKDGKDITAKDVFEKVNPSGQNDIDDSNTDTNEDW